VARWSGAGQWISPWVSALGLVLFALPSPAQDENEPVWRFQDELIDLRSLISISSAAFDVVIEYDPEKIEGEVWISSAAALTEAEVWALLNRELASRGWITVQPPGSDALRVVPIEKAPGLARLEDVDLAFAKAGFVKVIVPLETRTAEAMADAVDSLLSQPHGSVTAVRDGNALVVADFTDHVGQILGLLDLLDRRDIEPVVEEIALEFITPLAMGALIERVTSTRTKVTEQKLKGSALPLPESQSILVVAPPKEMPWWREVIERFDRPERVGTRQYVPHRFGLSETARLIEEVVKGADPAGSSWRLVQDELTGTLIVTTTPSRHREIRELLDRRESAEAGPRRPLRAFPIKNRQVTEVLEMLQALVDAGALAAAEAPAARASSEPQEPTKGPTAAIPTTFRPVRSDGSSSGPEVTLTADEGTNRILAFGEASLLDQLGLLIEALDVRNSQVLVEALAVIMTEDQSRQFGVELQAVGVEGDTFFQLASLFGLGSPDPLGTTLPSAAGSGLSTAVLNPGDFSAVLRALETISEGRSLTIPKVLVNNNQEATLDSTVQSPYAMVNATNTVATTSFGGTFDAGTTISVKPQVADGDQVVVDYTVSLSRFTGAPTDPALPPPRQETKLQSIVTIPDGYTVVVGGISIESETNDTSKVPWLGDIPIVQTIFQDRSRTRNKSRFFVFLRCNVMNAARFEDLRYLSDHELADAALDDGWPTLEPRVIR